MTEKGLVRPMVMGSRKEKLTDLKMDSGMVKLMDLQLPMDSKTPKPMVKDLDSKIAKLTG